MFVGASQVLCGAVPLTWHLNGDCWSFIGALLVAVRKMSNYIELRSQTKTPGD